MDHGFGLDVPETLADLCRPERLALVVYDMQVGIVPQLPDGRKVTRPVGDVLAAAREGGFRVFFTRHLSLPNEVAGVSQLRTAKAWQRARSVADVILQGRVEQLPARDVRGPDASLLLAPRHPPPLPPHSIPLGM
jgi:biuret amidohydrolase